MGKFKTKFSDIKRSVKASVKLKTALKGQQGLYTFFTIWFAIIKAYGTGSPSELMKKAFGIWVIPFVPGSWVCTDEGYVGVKAKRRCKLIHRKLKKEGFISEKNLAWINNELLKSFEEDFDMKNLDFQKLGSFDEDSVQKSINKAKNMRELVK